MTSAHASSSSRPARQNMVEGQIRPMGVVSPRVLEAFQRVPREPYLPPRMRAAAYLDTDIRLEGGAFLLSPGTQARMVEVLDPKPDDIVLNIGDFTGYSSAVLSRLVLTVVAVESRPGDLDPARRIWAEHGYDNIAVTSGSEDGGCPAHAPYTAILINGSVVSVPACLLDQLAPGGRLVAIERDPASPMGTVTVIRRIEGGGYSRHCAFDAAAPFVPKLAPASGFEF